MAGIPCLVTKEWTLIDSKAPQNNISYAGIDFEELLVVGIGTYSGQTNKAIYSKIITKQEIDLIGNTPSTWYSMGGYLNSNSYSFANFGIYGADEYIKVNVITDKGVNMDNPMWYVYYR